MRCPKEVGRVGAAEGKGQSRGWEGWWWRCGRCASDRTDGVHKARRAKLDREQKEREGEEVDEGENEHAVVGWGNKGTRESGKEGEKKRERGRGKRERKRRRQGCERYGKKGEYTGLRIKAEWR